jgi:hypothetical protein
MCSYRQETSGESKYEPLAGLLLQACKADATCHSFTHSYTHSLRGTAT